jgi:release factor glutamine methyltransferase
MLSAGLAAESSAGPLTLRAAIKKLGEHFQEAGLVNPLLDARILAAEACNLNAEATIIGHDAVLPVAEWETLASFAARRLAGEPVSRILGRREFWGLCFNISPATLDPRPETELLVETVLEHAKAKGLQDSRLQIADLGTGSGCLLAALLSELPRSNGVGVDRSEAALSVAQANLLQLGLLNRAALLCGDWLGAVDGARFDVIVCNPPYVETAGIAALNAEVKDHDPRLAVDGGADGLRAYREIIPQAWDALKPGGLLALEIGRSQGKAVLDLMKQIARQRGFAGAHVLADLSGADRAVAGVRQL